MMAERPLYLRFDIVTVKLLSYFDSWDPGSLLLKFCQSAGSHPLLELQLSLSFYVNSSSRV